MILSDALRSSEVMSHPEEESSTIGNAGGGGDAAAGGGGGGSWGGGGGTMPIAIGELGLTFRKLVDPPSLGLDIASLISLHKRSHPRVALWIDSDFRCKKLSVRTVR